MTQSRVFVPFEDFRGGEAGTLQGKDAPANSFFGLNVVPAIDGGIMPRCGLFDASPGSGRSVGKISGMGILNPALADDFFYIQGTHVFSWAIGGAVHQYTGTIVAPTHACDIVEIKNGQNHYIVVPDDAAYILDHSSRTVTKLTGSPEGKCIALYGVRLIIGGSDTEPQRIYFSGDDSNPADPNVWDALSYIDVGVGTQARGLYPMRDYLLIVKRDGALWRLSGTPGFDDTLRQISTHEQSQAAFQPGRGDLTPDGQFWSVGLFSTAPEAFNGGSLKSIENLGTELVYDDPPEGAWAVELSEGDTIPPQYAASSPSPSSISFFGEDRGLLRRHGAWSKHTFSRTVVGYSARIQHSAILLTNGGDDALVPSFWIWNTGDERPPIKDGGVKGWDSIGDTDDTANNARFTTPEWSDPQGRRVLVRGVVVTFDEYDTNLLGIGDPDDDDLFNHFLLSVTSRDRYAASSVTTSNTQEYLADPRDADAEGVNRRMEFGFGDQGLGQTFELNISQLRGIKIKSLLAIVDVSEGSPV